MQSEHTDGHKNILYKHIFRDLWPLKHVNMTKTGSLKKFDYNTFFIKKKLTLIFVSVK